MVKEEIVTGIIASTPMQQIGQDIKGNYQQQPIMQSQGQTKLNAQSNTIGYTMYHPQPTQAQQQKDVQGGKQPIHKPQLNQKECVKNELKIHLQKLKKEGKTKEPIHSNALRDVIVPLVKKQMALSYTIGPKLMYDWAQEVNEQFFNKEFKFHYASNSYRTRGGRSSVNEAAVVAALEKGNGKVILQGNQMKAYQQLESEHEQLKTNYKELVSQMNTLAQSASERENWIKLLTQQAQERQTLCLTIHQLNMECRELRETLRIANIPIPQLQQKPITQQYISQAANQAAKIMQNKSLQSADEEQQPYMSQMMNDDFYTSIEEVQDMLFQ